ncbi:MAG: iron complex outermembrane recepter protein [Gallionellaceae bacterium]|nr:MAG: iron complex outermembrane recepter protein [Gallionellaceae bacterium]
MSKYTVSSAALGALLGISTNTAFAADVATMDEVVVTATRTSATLSDAPAAVTVVNAKDIEEKNASRLGDVLDQVPGLYLRGGTLGQSQGTIGTSGMSLRGVDQTKTLVLLDGQPIQDASSGKVNWRIPFVEDISRVEVVPGSFSALYGSNAIGGVVNIITKQPDKREFTAKVKKGWGDASGEDASVYFRDKMENGLGFAGGIGIQNRDSYVNDFVVVKNPPVCTVPANCVTSVTGALATTTREGLPAYVVGDLGAVPWNSTNATAKLFYDLNARSKVFAGVSHQETRQDYTQFNMYLRNSGTGAVVPVPSGTLNINGRQASLTNSSFTLFSFQPLQESTARYFVGYDGVIGNNYLLKADLARIERTYSYTAANTTAAPIATWNSGTGTLYDTPNNGLDGSAQVTFPIGARHVLVTGLALHKDSVNQQIYALSNWRNPDSKTAVNSGYHGRSTTVSVFAQDEFSATGALKIYLGGRWDDWEASGDKYSNIAPAGATIYSKRSVSAFSPKASAVYNLSEAATLRASFGRSFRSPTNQDLYVTARIQGKTVVNNPDLQPERGTTWEMSGEFRLSENAKTNITYYDTRLSNLIPPRSTAATWVRYNAAKAKVRGVELGGAIKLASWLEMDANYSYNDSEILESAAEPASVGKRLTDSPKNIAGIGFAAQYGAWSGTLNARYISHVFLDPANADTVDGVPTSCDAQTTVNAKLGYAFSKNIKGHVAVNNLLDERSYSYFLNPKRNLVAGLDFTL